ncbi:MAG TPA: hypothetical protein VGL18_17110 [Actinomycetota bacterium]
MADRWLRLPGRGSRGMEPDPALERLVAEVGSLVDYPAVPDLSGVVGRRLRQAPTPSRWSPESLRLRLRGALRPVLQPVWQPVAVALIVLIVVLSGTLAFSPTARRAVAGWLGLRGVRIEFTPTPSATLPLGTGLNLGERLTLAEAQARVPFRIVVPHAPDLGPPDAVYLRSGNFAGQVTLLWHARPGLPRARETGEGLLLTEFRASVDAAFIKKISFEATTLEAVRVNGGNGFWIAGAPHEVSFVNENGQLLPDTVRLAGNVLLWEQGDLTVRIEGKLTKDQALRIARTVG